MASQGTFILADIGGYTTFLTGVGIQHGKEVTEHLLNRLIKTSRQKWKIANIMGDCVFFYTEAPENPEATFSGVQTLYREFQDAQLEVASGSACRCGACDRTEDLSLKFVVHSGEYDVQNIGGRKELIGQDIVLATRLLKNSVPAREYLIVTEPLTDVVEAAGLEATPGQDHVEGIGTTEYSYIDLEPLREQRRKSRERYITEVESRLTVIEEVDAPPDVVWEAMTDLRKRQVWQVTIKRMDHVQGPVGQVGEVHTCVHGGTVAAKIVHVTIALDNENRRITEQVWIEPALMKDSFITMSAEPLPNGKTCASFLSTFKPRFPVISLVTTPVFIRLMSSDIRKDMAGLKEFCETGRVAAREAATAGSTS